MNDIRFKLLNIRFRLSFWFLAIIALYSLLFENAIRVLLAIVLHESAHILVICLSGASVTEISLQITDINMKSNVHVLSKWGRIAVALAGPTANLLGCCTSYIAGDELFFGINLAIAIFQLLPCKGSDGGEVMTILLGHQGEFSVRLLSLISAFAVTAAAFLMLISGEVNLSLVIAGLYIVFMACK